LIGDQAAAANGAWHSGNVRSREKSTVFDARVAVDFTRLTRRGRLRSGCSLLKLSCESGSCRAIDARGFASPRAVSVENGAVRQFYGAVYTIYPRKMLWPSVSHRCKRAGPMRRVVRTVIESGRAREIRLIRNEIRPFSRSFRALHAAHFPTLFLNVSGQSWTNN
jgi:hypothetical protein